MKRCPITYTRVEKGLYSNKGLKLLSPVLKHLDSLDLTAEELRMEAMLRATKLSIQGVQPKLSAVLNIKQGKFELVDKGGRFILKPQHHLFPELPQNEDLTMRLAKIIGIEVPLHGLVYCKDGSMTYFIKRFDRKGQKDKLAVEDFAQLAGMSRETKYNYSMEKLVGLIDEYCTFPVLEKVKLFKLVVFNYLIGNEDMHLKNYSIIVKNGKVDLSPAYDLLNSTIVLKGEIEEIALTIKGKKSNLNSEVLINYFGKERCSLADKVVEKILDNVRQALPKWTEMIRKSFLSEEMKEKYNILLQNRVCNLGLDK
jgi:serine/threonine-protein kinase HipA